MKGCLLCLGDILFRILEIYKVGIVIEALDLRCLPVERTNCRLRSSLLGGLGIVITSRSRTNPIS